MGHGAKERDGELDREGGERKRQRSFAKVGVHLKEKKEKRKKKKRMDHYRVDLFVAVIKELNLGGETTSTVRPGSQGRLSIPLLLTPYLYLAL